MSKDEESQSQTITLFMIHVYSWPHSTITIIMLLLLSIWGFIGKIASKNMWRTINHILVAFAVVLIFHYSIQGRSPSENHSFSFFAPYTNEFYREMVMNVFLYFPLGLSLTVLIGPWSILVAFVLSLGIETWQYCAGTGLAQGTDVLCNTLGCAIGAIPWLVNRWIDKRRNRAETGNKENQVQNE